MLVVDAVVWQWWYSDDQEMLEIPKKLAVKHHVKSVWAEKCVLTQWAMKNLSTRQKGNKRQSPTWQYGDQ